MEKIEGVVEEVARFMLSRGITISVAESCTGGLISHMLTQLPGSSGYFILGTVTYHNRAKTHILGVSPLLISQRGAVDEDVARAMAQGVRARGETHIGLATTGIAGPGGGSEKKPVGMLCIGYSSPTRLVACSVYSENRDRHYNKKFFALSALKFLKAQLDEDYGQ